MIKAERILLISSLYPPRVIGGAEIVVRNLAAGFAKQGHQVCVATLAPRAQAKDWLDAGVSVKQFEMRYRHWPFAGAKTSRLQKFLWHVADNFDPDFYQHLRCVIEEFAPNHRPQPQHQRFDSCCVAERPTCLQGTDYTHLPRLQPALQPDYHVQTRANLRAQLQVLPGSD